MLNSIEMLYTMGTNGYIWVLLGRMDTLKGSIF